MSDNADDGEKGAAPKKAGGPQVRKERPADLGQTPTSEPSLAADMSRLQVSESDQLAVPAPSGDVQLLKPARWGQDPGIVLVKDVPLRSDVAAKTEVDGYGILDMIKDINGGIGFTEDKAAIGFIQEWVKVQVPTNLGLPTQFGKKLALPGNTVYSILAKNFQVLNSNGMSAADAMHCAMLRLMMIQNGFLLATPTQRCVYEDEVARYAETPQVPKDFKVTRELTTFWSDYWANVVAVVAHVFRVRGHHFKEEYTELYNRTWRSTTITTISSFPSWQVISTKALHPFGIAALEAVSSDAASRSRLSKSLLLRRNAACAGSAPIRTTAAALKEMSQSRWWEFFYAKFKKDIDEIQELAVKVESVGTRAHINARLYKWEDKYQPFSTDSVEVVAPYVMGWIDTLDRSEPISKQAAITKRAQGGSAIRSTFQAVLMREAGEDRSMSSVKAYFEKQ